MEPQRVAKRVWTLKQKCIWHFVNHVYCGDEITGAAHLAASANPFLFTRVEQSPRRNIA
jgi:hypothetical protein